MADLVVRRRILYKKMVKVRSQVWNIEKGTTKVVKTAARASALGGDGVL